MAVSCGPPSLISSTASLACCTEGEVRSQLICNCPSRSIVLSPNAGGAGAGAGAGAAGAESNGGRGPHGGKYPRQPHLPDLKGSADSTQEGYDSNSHHHPSTAGRGARNQKIWNREVDNGGLGQRDGSLDGHGRRRGQRQRCSNRRYHWRRSDEHYLYRRCFHRRCLCSGAATGGASTGADRVTGSGAGS